LNQKFGFKIVRTTPRYYEDPREATVVMERRL
jgi:ribosomal protein S18 acetylase RimI-like enzyme